MNKLNKYDVSVRVANTIRRYFELEESTQVDVGMSKIYKHRRDIIKTMQSKKARVQFDDLMRCYEFNFKNGAKHG